MGNASSLRDFLQDHGGDVQLFGTDKPKYENTFIDFVVTGFGPLKGFLDMLEESDNEATQKIGIIARRLFHGGLQLLEDLDDQIRNTGVCLEVGAEGPTCVELEQVTGCRMYAMGREKGTGARQGQAHG